MIVYYISFQIYNYYYWYPVFVVGYVGAYAVMIGLLFVPESPIVLFEKNKFQEVRETLIMMAKINRTANVVA